MKDYSELKKLAEDAPSGPWRYWGETANEIFQCSGKRVLIIAHDQSVPACEFIASANPAVVLELIAEVESLRKDAARYRWLRQYDFDIGSYHPEGDFSHESWFERFDDQSIDRMIAEEIAFEEEAIIEANNK